MRSTSSFQAKSEMAPVYRDYAARRANYLDAVDSFVRESMPPGALSGMARGTSALG